MAAHNQAAMRAGMSDAKQVTGLGQHAGKPSITRAVS